MRVKRWIEKIQEFDFNVRYIKGSEIGLADKLSREEYEKQEKRKKHGEKIKSVRWNKHVKVIDDKEVWVFDNGKVAEIPKIEDRKKLCVDMHEKLLHRSAEYVLYELRKRYYWPGVKQTVINVVKTCVTCQINNRKNKTAPEYVTTVKPYEKIALDLIQITNMKGYIVLGIDYYTRQIAGEVIYDKSGLTIARVLHKWFENGHIPEELITDNGKEFCNVEMTNICKKFGIVHTQVGVEAHRSNGRIERAIKSIKEALWKRDEQLTNIEHKLSDIISQYNETFHRSIKCTPNEAYLNYESYYMHEKNNDASKWKNKYGKINIKLEKFAIGEEVRVAQGENLSKDLKGRFLRLGEILNDFGSGSYLVKMHDTGQIRKLTNDKLKKIVLMD